MCRRRLELGLGILSLSLMGCPPPYKIWLLPGATAEQLTFRLATRRIAGKALPVNRVLLTTCPGYTVDLRRLPLDTLWSAQLITEDIWDGPVVGQLRYGASLPGFRTFAPAQALRPGCYSITVNAYPGSAVLEFWIEADGRARTLTQTERDSSFGLYARHIAAEFRAETLAVEWCRREYQRARNARESAQVNTLIPWDTARFDPLNCGDFRRLDKRLQVRATANQ